MPRYLIELYRSQRAQVEIDTDDYPEETAGWDQLDKKALRAAQEAAAHELVEWFEADNEDEGMAWVRIVTDDELDRAEGETPE